MTQLDEGAGTRVTTHDGPAHLVIDLVIDLVTGRWRPAY